MPNLILIKFWNSVWYFSGSDGDTETVINLLKEQTTTLKLLLEEQKRTNKILSQLFAADVDVEPWSNWTDLGQIKNKITL